MRPRTVYTLETYDDGGALLHVARIGPRIRDARTLAQAEFPTTPEALARLAQFFARLADAHRAGPTG
jgi:elongation factor P--beta-lysine ligase